MNSTLQMAFDKTTTTVLRATEPSVILGHDNRAIYKLCNGTERKSILENTEGQKLNPMSNNCLMLWAESLGTRSSLGKILLQWLVK